MGSATEQSAYQFGVWFVELVVDSGTYPAGFGTDAASLTLNSSTIDGGRGCCDGLANFGIASVTLVSDSVVPEPASVTLLGAGLGWVRRRNA